MTDILAAESDNNVKLIILNRMMALMKRHERTLQGAVMDILKTLSTPNVGKKKKKGFFLLLP